MADRPATTLVLGLGNPWRGDDGVGPALIAALQADSAPPDATLLDGGTAGLEMIVLWEGYERVIVVDAAEMGCAPGTWQRFDLDHVRLTAHPLTGTLHAAGLAEALALAQALGQLPPQLILFGIQPHNVDWQSGLSPAVAAALPGLGAAVRQAIIAPLP